MRRLYSPDPERDLDSTPSAALGTDHGEVQAAAARMETP